MLRRAIVVAGLSLGAVTFAFVSLPPVSAQQATRVDFAREVQPLLQQNCVGCHGPTQQLNGLRLDRRGDAMRGSATGAVIGPGNSAGSRLYHRLTGNRFGPQMPPTGALRSEQIEIIKNWIDQGAEWPDALANDVPPVPADPGATEIIDAIRRGTAHALTSAVSANAAAVNARGGGGATPLMWAALDGDLSSTQLLIERGADPNLANDAGATALMWAIPDVDKVRLLLEKGANPNARSKDGRTALMIASGIHGASPVVKLLLDKGANVSEAAPSLFGSTTALTEAAYAGDEATFRLLLERGLKPKMETPVVLAFAMRSNCTACVELMLKGLPPPMLGVVAALASPPFGDSRAIKFLLDSGADANARDMEGRTLLMLAASSDHMPIETVNALLEKGADVNLTSPKGETALALSRLRGQTPVLEALMKAGARDASDTVSAAAPAPAPAGSPRTAIERTIPLLQKTDVTFLRKSGCVSCHNNTLTAMTVASVRKRGIAVDETIAREQKTKIGKFLESWRERTLLGVGIPGNADTVSYILLGLAAENYAPDAGTDAMARFLLYQQSSDGHWRLLAHRPPIESSEIEVTAATLRVLQLYAPQNHRAAYDRAIERGTRWLAQAQPLTTEDRAFQLFGLKWTGAQADVIRAASRSLVAEQRSDGGWSQLASLTSDAYATGQALVALIESGAMTTTDPAYKRGVQFLINQQLADGSWYVKTRALPIQPHFESDFPHGRDQFISAAATNWAAMALALGVN